LQIRNEIYRQAFDLTWVRENTSINWVPIVAGIAVVVGLLALTFVVYNAVIHSFWTPDQWHSQNDQNLTGKTVFALAGCNDGTLFAGAEDGVYSRGPDAIQWRQEISTTGEVHGLAAGSDCATVYAAVLNQGVLRHDDDSWTLVSTSDMSRTRTVALSGDKVLVGGDFGIKYSVVGPVHHWESCRTRKDLDDKLVMSLVRSDGWIYAAVWGGGVWRCPEDDCDLWEPKGLDEEYALQAIGSPTDGEPWLVGLDDGFYRWAGTGSNDDWEQPELWGNVCTFCFAIDSTVAYAGQQGSGVLRSTDGGWTWGPMNNGWGPPSQVRTLLIRADEDDRRWLYAGTTEGAWRYPLPQVPVCNGDFDHNFECWQHGGELDQAVECDENQCYAILGNPDYPCAGSVPVGEAWIRQSFEVPSTISPTLSLRYRVFSYDLDNLDFFEVSINGKPVGQYGNTEWNESNCDREAWDSGWQSVEFSLSSYRGKKVEVSLRNVNGTHEWWNTWTCIDDVEIR